MMRFFVLITLLGSPAFAGPKSASDCVATPPSSSSDELSGTTYLWVKDLQGGAAPSAGAVVRLDFYGGAADIDATNGTGGPTVWSGTYSLGGGKITIAMDGEGISVNVKSQPYTRSGDDLTLPFGLVKGNASLWHRSQQKIVTRIVRAACLATPMKPSCSRPNGIGTSSFGKDCLFWDTTLDGKLLEHRQQCVVSCDSEKSKPETMSCDACFAGLENKVAFSNFNGLDDNVRKQLAKLYGQLVTAAQPDSYARCVAEANVYTAEQNQTKVLASNATHAQEDAATKAVSVAKAALAALATKDDPSTRVKLEEQIVSTMLASMIPYQKVCGFDPVPSVKFHYMGEYSAPVVPDTDCDLDGADLSSPTQLSPLTSSTGFEQQVYDSLFYSRNATTGAIVADRYESAAAALLHEGFHHGQYQCGRGFASSDAARSMILELTEIMTYALSASLPFYQFMLDANERTVWTDGGRRVNLRAFEALWQGKRWCPKKKQNLDNPTPTTDAEKIETASFAWSAYGWMSARMIGGSQEDHGIWKTLCKPQSPTLGIPCANTSKMNEITAKLPNEKCR
jgi:hypothetical protein